MAKEQVSINVQKRQVANITKLLAAGYNVARIASSMRTTSKHIKSIIKANNITYTEPDYIELIKNLVLEGKKNQTEIADALGCSPSFVNGVIKKNGFAYKKTDFAPKIISLFTTSDMDAEKIAESLGCSVSYARTVIGTYKQLEDKKYATK